MSKEVLIMDMDDTLKSEQGCFEGVGGFLARQAAKRDCIIATYQDGSTNVDENFGMIIENFGELGAFLVALYPREIIAKAEDYHRLPDGRIVHLKEVHDFKPNLIVGIPYKNPFMEIPEEKDLYLVRELHAQRKKVDLPKAVFLGDYVDVQVGCTDPETPVILVNDTAWAQRRKVEALLDRLFENSTYSVFDEIYAAGVPVADKFLPIPWWMDKDGFTLGESVEVNFEEAVFRLSKKFNGQAIRMIEEVI